MVTEFAETGVFQLFNSHWGTGADAFLWEAQKQKSRSLMLDGSETHSTALSQADGRSL